MVITLSILSSVLFFATFTVARPAAKSAILPTSDLPSPSGLTLQYIALGVGTQNYTCATSTTASVPVPDGALATLYDATTFFSKPGHQSAMSSLLDSNLALKPNKDLDVLGHHYFVPPLTPTFDLGATLLSAKRLAKVPSPTGAIDWLYLVDDLSGRSHGLKAVYRVETIGGKAPATCDGLDTSKVLTVNYAAEYWLYN
ncbi:hypothetical protein LTR66_003075 [Elasticomyces elasticus]|nr:hypothetical protein LTR50_003510 [Elasticomyces elasticus]KAK4997524.1 hypothetical protein LTR66_003075 [Elasticomyces elasticus]